MHSPETNIDTTTETHENEYSVRNDKIGSITILGVWYDKFCTRDSTAKRLKTWKKMEPKIPSWFLTFLNEGTTWERPCGQFLEELESQNSKKHPTTALVEWLNTYFTLNPNQEKVAQALILESIQQSRANLAESNLGLVYTIAKRYCELDGVWEDAISEGKLGLMLSTRTYNFRNKKTGAHAPFSTHASYWIKKYINAYLTADRYAEFGIIDRIKNFLDQINQFELDCLQEKTPFNSTTIKAELKRRNEKPPSEYELNEIFAIRGIRFTSLDYDNGNPKDDSPLERILAEQPDESAVDYEKLAKILLYILNDACEKNYLNPEVIPLIIMRYNLDGKGPRTYDDIAKMYPRRYKNAQGPDFLIRKYLRSLAILYKDVKFEDLPDQF